jgi:hypothetical protein
MPTKVQRHGRAGLLPPLDDVSYCWFSTLHHWSDIRTGKTWGYLPCHMPADGDD